MTVSFAIEIEPRATLPIMGTDQVFPIRRIYCIGRNYAGGIRAVKLRFSFKKPRMPCKCAPTTRAFDTPIQR